MSVFEEGNYLTELGAADIRPTQCSVEWCKTHSPEMFSFHWNTTWVNTGKTVLELQYSSSNVSMQWAVKVSNGHCVVNEKSCKLHGSEG